MNLNEIAEEDLKRRLAKRVEFVSGLSLSDEKKAELMAHFEEFERSAQFTSLDSSAEKHIGSCEHATNPSLWCVDEELPNGNKHWVCSKCGFGRYSQHRP